MLLSSLTAPFLLQLRKCYEILVRYFAPDVLREELSTNFSSFRKLLVRFFFGLLDYIFTFHLPKFMTLFILFEYNFRFFDDAFLILTTWLIHLPFASFQASPHTQYATLCFHSSVLQPLHHL